MAAFILVLLVLLALGILGAVVKGLLWLTFIAVLLAFGAGVYTWSKLRR